MSSPPFTKLLIANRGEIAIRIMRACKELGIRTVAVYSTADSGSLHTLMADEAVLLGEAAPRESYLNIEKIIHAAQQTGAQAVHPGYGFLSENAAFAGAVTSAGLAFIGPSAESIRLMGDKAESKIRMKQAGVPTVPGREGLETEKAFKEAAKEIGYPVLIKAAAGGGGRGMRIVRRAGGMREAIEEARREALNAFGDERLLIEKYLTEAHHVEFQVFGDQHGNLVHLFERECSVQRRHQKIIEETPSPLLTPELREEMGQAAVAAAQAVDYFNAGTVEFIVNPTSLKFYFLEMNTRLQVEHPITELVAGLDLVQWQIRAAAGERFPFTQAELAQRGHAIECRVYAEDPASGFLPSTGKLLQFIEPRGPGIRLDSGFARGGEVTHYYDPLLAKLIVHAEDRPAAIQKIQAALREFIVHGVVTNIDFMQAVLAHPDFAGGRVTTRWVETNFNWEPPDDPPVEALVAAALSDLSLPGAGSQAPSRGEFDPFSPWKKPSGFRN
jgi:acetyl-CoA carboxylase biotin carboxylase subunit